MAGLASAAAWPVVARAQPAAVTMIGFLHPGPPDTPGSAFIFAAVRRGLAEMGYVEGRNLGIEYQWAQDHMERLPELAADLVRLPVAAVVTVSTGAALALQGATKSTPIVFSIGTDQLESALSPVSIGPAEI
jgi:putative tryptophan/tyrosine transport system substrate-binding protein